MVVPTKIDYKNRRFELMEELELTDSVETDKDALMERIPLGSREETKPFLNRSKKKC